VTIDGATFASLLAGIDFTAARRGWYRRLGAKEAR
jgi:transposase